MNIYTTHTHTHKHPHVHAKEKGNASTNADTNAQHRAKTFHEHKYHQPCEASANRMRGWVRSWTNKERERETKTTPTLEFAVPPLSRSLHCALSPSLWNIVRFGSTSTRIQHLTLPPHLFSPLPLSVSQRHTHTHLSVWREHPTKNILAGTPFLLIPHFLPTGAEQKISVQKISKRNPTAIEVWLFHSILQSQVLFVRSPPSSGPSFLSLSSAKERSL